MNTLSLNTFHLSINNTILLDNTLLKIVKNNKYGLIGRNGSGKTTLMKRIKEITKDSLYIEQEVDFSEDTVHQTVLNANEERITYLKQFQTLSENQEDDVLLNDDIDISYNDEANVSKILNGLGFTEKEQHKPVNSFSGGWKKRISLAKALYMCPSLLLLDEPTNHLDLETVIWLSNYLSKWKKTLIIVSHSRNFLNEICNNIISFEGKKLEYYKGDYDSFDKQYLSKTTNHKNDWNKYQKIFCQMKKKNRPKKELDLFIKSMNTKGIDLLNKPEKDYKVNFELRTCDSILKKKLISFENVFFSYSSDKIIFNKINFDIYPDSKIALVGRNGIGKSTFLHLINNKLKPIDGYVVTSNNVTIACYDQHFVEEFNDRSETAIQYINQILHENLTETRKLLGMVGLPGEFHKHKISDLSGGQKARVMLASLNAIKPNLLLLDEPSNHLDLESVQALIKGVENFNGAVVLVSHEPALINDTNCELFFIEDHCIKKYHGDFQDYVNDILE